MNIRWLKQNWGTVLFAVVFGVVLGLLLWLLDKARDHRSQVEGNLAMQQQQLNELEAKNPFPSNENIQRYRDDQKRIHQFQQAVQTAITNSFALPTEAEIKTDIEFVEQMPKRLAALTFLTQQAGVRLPDKFNFGFDRYATTLPCRNPPAAGAECERVLALLSKQFLVIERLTTLFFTNNVDEIVAIRRTAVEPGSGGEDASLPITRDGRAQCTITPFELQFACTAAALQGFINDVARDPWLFAIRNLKVDVPGGALGVTAMKHGESRRVSVTVRVDLLEFQQQRLKPDRPPRGKPTTP